MTSSLKLLLVAGARPNFMKIAPVLRGIQARHGTFNHVLVHTGQHYDEGMSDVFFRELEIPAPDYHLSVGSGSHAQQTARIMTAFEPVLDTEKPDCVVVFGDVNSTLACSIVAKKSGYPVAHVEAGLRSGDMSMPEEVNRIVTDSITDYFFVTEESGLEHLRHEGKPDKKVFHVGHVMIDNLYFELERLEREPIVDSALQGSRPPARQFCVATLHRPSNVDDKEILGGIMSAIGKIAETLPVIFPVHPRTRANLQQFDIPVSTQITLTKPLGYREFLRLWRDAALVLTDSGGLQEETTALGVPCVTIRENTERPITLTAGSNMLVGCKPQAILDGAKAMLNRYPTGRSEGRPALWDGRASDRILDILARELRHLAS
ncbi:MAG: UDP-N-acetylglucosamine 2-epimerase (non-hydrolyzing) [Pseudomonadales bacterium]